MGYNQEAYDAECATIARELGMASLQKVTPETVTIFTDAQAAIRRIASEEPASPVPVGCMRSRQGSTLQRYGGPSKTLPLRFGGVRRTNVFQEMRELTSGPNLRQRSQTPA